jgi:hypothetical protein
MIENADPHTASAVSAYLATVAPRLAADGFLCTLEDEGPYVMTAHRSRLEISKLANVDTSFLFAYLPSPSIDELRRFSAGCFRSALAARKGWRLPRGLFEGVFCYSVALVDSAAPEVAQSVRNELPPKHFSAIEIRIVYELPSARLFFYEKTPIWGAAYAAGQRNLIRRMLS